jgi:hypothetical protein
MPSEQLIRAINLAKSGQKDIARQILLKIVEQEPHNEMAWIWLVDTMPTDAQRIATIKQCLNHIPSSKNARRALEAFTQRQSNTEDQQVAEDIPADIKTDQQSPVETESEWSEDLVEDDEALLKVFMDDLEEEPSVEDVPHAGEESPFDETEPESLEADNLVAALRPELAKQKKRQPRPQSQKPEPEGSVEKPESPRWWVVVLASLAILFMVAILVTVIFSPRSPIRAMLFPPTPENITQVETDIPPVDENEFLETQEEPGFEETLVETEPVQTEEAEFATVTGTPSPPGLNLGGTGVNSLEWSADGNQIVISSAGGVTLFNGRNLQTLRYLDTPSNQSQCRLSTQGNLMACGGAVIQLWRLPEGERLATLDLIEVNDETTLWLAIDPDGTQIAAVYNLDATLIRFWTTTVEILPLELTAPAAIQRFEYSPVGRRLAAGLSDGSLVIWDLRSPDLSPTRLENHSDAVTALAFSPTGDLIATSDSRNMILLDIDEQVVMQTFDGLRGVRSLTFSPDGQLLAAGTESSAIFIWQVQTGELLNSISGPGSMVDSISFSPDGIRLAAAFTEGIIFFYDELN